MTKLAYYRHVQYRLALMCAKIRVIIFCSFLDILEYVEWPSFLDHPVNTNQLEGPIISLDSGNTVSPLIMTQLHETIYKKQTTIKQLQRFAAHKKVIQYIHTTISCCVRHQSIKTRTTLSSGPRVTTLTVAPWATLYKPSSVTWGYNLYKTTLNYCPQGKFTNA